MSYRVEITPLVRRKISSWSLPDFVLVDVYLRLQELSQSPADYLVRTRLPFEGMVFPFATIDPQDRLCEHFFIFAVVYAQDEESLLLVNAGYQRRVGL